LTAARIVHADDESEMREVVRRSLGLDPDLVVQSCASGAEALAAVRKWPPDLVLLDDVMPDMNAPRILAELRLDRSTATVPVVFMTAATRMREVSYFKSLGAAGVLLRPFDAAGLVEAVRRFLKPRSDLEAMREEFFGRAKEYANELASCLTALSAGADRADQFVHIRQIAHRLTDAGAIFGHGQIDACAMALEDTLIADGPDADIQKAIDTLLACISAAVGNDLETPVRLNAARAFADPIPSGAQ
jgi:CheY-like chemotaxis protein